MNTGELTVAYRELHRLACQKLHIDPEARGSRRQIADRLGVSQQQYSDAMNGRRKSFDTLVDWAGKLNLQVVYQQQRIKVADSTPVIDAAAASLALSRILPDPAVLERVLRGQELGAIVPSPMPTTGTAAYDAVLARVDSRELAEQLYRGLRRALPEISTWDALEQALRIRPQDDPLYVELQARANVQLMVSADLSGSKNLKQGGTAVYENPWITKFGQFYSTFVREVQGAYARLPTDQKNQVLDRHLKLFRVDDDDLLFAVEVHRHQDVLAHLSAVLRAVEQFNARREPHMLRCKATAWLCGIPISELELRDEGNRVIAYTGPNMDLGYALKHWALPDRMALSIEVATMLLDTLAAGSDAEGPYVQYGGLDRPEKEVYRTASYPRLHLLRHGGDKRPVDLRREPDLSAGEVQELLREYRKENFMEGWFLKRDPDPKYAGPTREWLRRYRLLKQTSSPEDPDEGLPFSRSV